MTTFEDYLVTSWPAESGSLFIFGDPTFMLPGGIGSIEMVLLGIVAVILFGGRLPEVARSLGNTYGQFRKGLDELKTNFDQEMEKGANSDLPAITHEQDNDWDRDEDDEESLPDAPQFTPPSDD